MRWNNDKPSGEGNWEIVKNFRVGRLNLNYSSVDVQWNPSINTFINIQ